MSLTPRQIDAYLRLSEQLDRFEQAKALGVAALGAQGDTKEIQKTLRELSSPWHG
jgi:hypothetical protein